MYHLKGFGLVPVVCLVLASCGGSGSGSETAASNLEPVVTGDQTIAVLEGVQLTNAYSASDPEDGTVTLSLAGTDASVMTLSAAGDLTFNTVPDFEAPLDSDTDNVYNVSVVASDSVNETSYAVAITVANATEGRVVDGPVSGAKVFIDANGDGVQNDDEAFVSTDAQGNYALPVPLSYPASIVSIGGTDTQTGKVLPDLALVSEVASAVATVAITPLTTVLVGIESETDKTAFLTSLGITGSAEELLAADGWALAESGDAGALAAQRVSQQIAGVMQAISSVTASSQTAETSVLDVAKAVASKIAAASTDASFSLSSPASLQSIVTESVTVLVTDGAASAAVIAAVADSIAAVNEVIADPEIDPTSASAADIVTAVQETVQASIVALVEGTITTEAFVTNSSVATLFTALPPRITLLGAATVALEQGTAYTDAGATALDVVDGVVAVTTAGTVDSSTAGTYTLTYTASDSGGNAATAVTRTVTVADTTAPVISLVGSAAISLEKDATYTDAGATATDAVDGTLTVTTTGTVDTATVGVYTLTYSVADSSANAATAVTRTVTVTAVAGPDVDTTGPVIVITGSASVNVAKDATYQDAGATASDAVDGTVAVTATGSTAVNTATVGDYTITYSATDAAGNTSTATRTVSVIAAASIQGYALPRSVTVIETE
jgi:hypothetical protein